MTPVEFFHTTLINRQVSLARVTNNRFQFLYEHLPYDNGKVLGSHAENEQCWREQNDAILYTRVDGTITTIYDRLVEINGRPILLGSYTKDSRFDHALIPYESNSDWKVVVSSCWCHAPYTLPRMFTLLKSIGLTETKVIVVVGGAPREGVEGSCRLIREEMWEFNGLLEVARNPPDCEYVFLLHDTMDPLPSFPRLVDNFNVYIKPELVSTLQDNSFNMGLYKVNFLQRLRPFLESLNGCSKERAWALEQNVDPQSFPRQANPYCTTTAVMKPIYQSAPGGLTTNLLKLILDQGVVKASGGLGHLLYGSHGYEGMTFQQIWDHCRATPLQTPLPSWDDIPRSPLPHSSAQAT